MPGTATVTSQFEEFLINSGKLWKLLKETKEKIEPLSKTKEAFEIADHARVGELPAYTGVFEQVRKFMANEKDRLQDLAREKEDYWMEISDVNMLLPATMMRAKLMFQEWIKNLTALRQLFVQFLPVAQAAQSLLSNPAVIGLRSGIEETSLTALDGIAFTEIVGNLNASNRCIDTILPRLRNCLTSLH